MITKSFVELIAINKNREILLQHRTADAPRNPGKWDFFGGGIEQGESPEEALSRELMEELELRVPNSQLYRKTETLEEGMLQTRYYFIAEINIPREDLLKNQHEGQGLGWFPLDKIREVDLVTHHKQVLYEFINHQ